MIRHGTFYESPPTSQDATSKPVSAEDKRMAVGFVDDDATCAAAEQTTALEPVPAADLAAYMADMLQELRQLAAKSGMDTLGRVLEIAEREAKAGRS